MGHEHQQLYIAVIFSSSIVVMNIIKTMHCIRNHQFLTPLTDKPGEWRARDHAVFWRFLRFICDWLISWGVGGFYCLMQSICHSGNLQQHVTTKQIHLIIRAKESFFILHASRVKSGCFIAKPSIQPTHIPAHSNCRGSSPFSVVTVVSVFVKRGQLTYCINH